MLALAGLAATAAAASYGVSAVATRRFRTRYERDKAHLVARARSAAPHPLDVAAAARLPLPVRKYAEAARSFAKPFLKVAVLRQKGGIRTAATKPWRPFESEQVYSLEPPGFLWLARARAAPFVSMLARDEFVGGKGNMLIRLLGAFTVVDARGSEIDQGAGLRYWGEIICFPEAALGPALRWEPIDDARARFSVAGWGPAVSAVVDFDASGFPVATHAERYRDVGGGKAVLTPWSGYSREWKAIDGRMFPTRWESVWHLPEGDFPAVRMEILRVRTE